jgi:hypothetical protein
VGEFKLKIFILVFSLFLFINLFLIINNDFLIKADGAEVSIVGEPTYVLIKDIIKNNVTIGKIYEINVTLINSGFNSSEELIVNLTDEEHFSLSKKIFLNQNETKVVSFTWSTLLIKNQQIIVCFYPSNLDTDWNKYNSGSKAFTLYITDEKDKKTTNTPGFEIIIEIIAILIFIFLLKKRIRL